MRQKHQKTNHRIYKIYRGMKSRCSCKTDYHYKWYGEKGIKVCDEWLNDFMSFYNWSMQNGYADDLSIDRINNNGNYEPNNCRWITQQEQCNNTRRNHYITINGETLTITQWAKKSGVNRKAIERKLKKGITGEKLLEPVITPHKGAIIQKDLQGNIVKEWKSLQEIIENTNFTKTPIANVCKNKKHCHTSYGYIWEYKKED